MQEITMKQYLFPVDSLLKVDVE